MDKDLDQRNVRMLLEFLERAITEAVGESVFSDNREISLERMKTEGRIQDYWMDGVDTYVVPMPPIDFIPLKFTVTQKSVSFKEVDNG